MDGSKLKGSDEAKVLEDSKPTANHVTPEKEKMIKNNTVGMKSVKLRG